MIRIENSLTVFAFVEKYLKHFRKYLTNASSNTIVRLIILLAILAIIPITVLIAQKRQEIRQHADTCNPGDYQIQCSSSCGACPSGQGQGEVFQCDANGNWQDAGYPQCDASCGASCNGGTTTNGTTTGTTGSSPTPGGGTTGGLNCTPGAPVNNCDASSKCAVAGGHCSGHTYCVYNASGNTESPCQCEAPVEPGCFNGAPHRGVCTGNQKNTCPDGTSAVVTCDDFPNCTQNCIGSCPVPNGDCRTGANGVSGNAFCQQFNPDCPTQNAGNTVSCNFTTGQCFSTCVPGNPTATPTRSPGGGPGGPGGPGGNGNPSPTSSPTPVRQPSNTPIPGAPTATPVPACPVPNQVTNVKITCPTCQ